MANALHAIDSHSSLLFTVPMCVMKEQEIHTRPTDVLGTGYILDQVVAIDKDAKGWICISI